MAKDLGLDANNDLPTFGYPITGAELVRQRALIRLSRHLGEWFMNPAEGLPYIDWLQQRSPDVSTIAARLRQVLRDTVGVISVESLTGVFDREAYTLTFTGLATVLDSEQVSILITPVLAGQVNPFPVVLGLTSGAVINAGAPIVNAP